MGENSPVEIAVLEGKIQQPITILYNRSIAEDVEVLEGGVPGRYQSMAALLLKPWLKGSHSFSVLLSYAQCDG